MLRFACKQGGQIVLTEVNTHWSDNLVPSPNKRDLVFQHMKGPGLHSYVEQPNGVKKVCVLTRSYMQISPAPFHEKHHYSPVQAFLADVPTQKRYFIFGTMLNSPQPMHIITITLFIFTTDRYCYLISISEIEAVLCLQAFSSVSAFPFAYYVLFIVVLHACQ